MKKFMLLGAAGLASASLFAGLYGDVPDAKHAWSVHDWNRPKPAKVSVNEKGIPSDAIILFDGTKASFEKNWCDEKGNPSQWKLSDEGYFYTVPNWKNGGGIFTRQEFGDCQLHIEYRHDPEQLFKDKGPQMRGNSGVFLMGPKYGYEVQVLESYYTSKDAAGTPEYVDNYTDGQAGSVYAENPPLVNPQHKPGEWQKYDIVFHQPSWKDGKLVQPGSITVFFNGVLVQDHWEVEGETTHCRRRPLAPHPLTGPLHLQDHGCVVAFRNIWIRPLKPRWANTTHSEKFAVEADVMAERAKAAADLYNKIDFAAGEVEVVNRLLEVISYDKSDKYVGKCREMCQAYVAKLEKMDDAELEKAKGDINRTWNSVSVLNRGKVLPADCKLTATLKAIREKKGWK